LCLLPVHYHFLLHKRNNRAHVCCLLHLTRKEEKKGMAESSIISLPLPAAHTARRRGEGMQPLPIACGHAHKTRKDTHRQQHNNYLLPSEGMPHCAC